MMWIFAIMVGLGLMTFSFGRYSLLVSVLTVLTKSMLVVFLFLSILLIWTFFFSDSKKKAVIKS